MLKPSYTSAEIKKMDDIKKMVRAFDGSAYYPGVIGLNNIKANDYANVVFHVSLSIFFL